MRKGEYIHIRVSEEEKREWQESAKSEGCSLAAWIRMNCVLSVPPKPKLADVYLDPKAPVVKRPGLKPITPQMKAAVKFLDGFQEHLNDGSPLPVTAKATLGSQKKATYPKHPASRIKRGRPKTSERLRSMREGR